jgi:hypothetical protein
MFAVAAAAVQGINVASLDSDPLLPGKFAAAKPLRQLLTPDQRVPPNLHVVRRGAGEKSGTVTEAAALERGMDVIELHHILGGQRAEFVGDDRAIDPVGG